MQQLRDLVNNLFVVFIQVMRERKKNTNFIESEITSGDFIQGSLLGTLEALYEKERQSITLTVNEISPFSIGVLIALFKRAVGFYASLINISAYHQPRVKAGKIAAEAVLCLQSKILDFFSKNLGCFLSLADITKATSPNHPEEVFKICQYLSANSRRRIQAESCKSPFEARYRME